MFQATRRRLAIWYTTVTAVLLLLFATGVYLYAENTLIERVDDTLKHVVEVVERSLAIEPSPEYGLQVNLKDSFRDNNYAGVEDDRIDIEWFSPNGELLWSTLDEPLEIPLKLGRSVEQIGSRQLRQMTKRVEFGRYVLGYLRVSHPWFEVTKPIRQLIVDLTLGTSLMIVCTAAIGWWLSGIAIEPVRQSYQSLKQFTADASHELRNPLATIQTNVQMALAYPEAEPQQIQRQLQTIERLTQRLGRLVNDLLFLARSDSGIVETSYQILPLDALLIEVIEEQRAIAEQKNIYLSLHLVEPPPETYPDAEDVFNVKGDWDQLARLFTNLIGNALAHSETTGDREAAIQVELQLIKRSHHPWFQIKVSDTGKGIPEAALPYIFERFYRVDPARSRSQSETEKNTFTGAGLGLAIARAIVENHRGHITVESQLNLGTTFTVTLPAAKPEATLQ
ncbi:MAG: HAMP domain-containing sensor histidine kinase [Oscillatoria sp. PMC 1051.18]|nr:HAMP domain-containing sensor histidine kinase [Oscillatoria sp. PMC 1050.18]MEC5030388.1 HAMP domain-containing sensor histidine kinase [Oscillatoria sp. PMC 1051.18]